MPEREVNYGFNDFNLSGLDRIALKPGSKELLLTHLENNEQRTISWQEGGETEERLENYLIRYLLDHDEIDYDEHADMLYKLAGQMVSHLCSYQPQEDAESVLKMQAVNWQNLCGHKSNKICGQRQRVIPDA